MTLLRPVLTLSLLLAALVWACDASNPNAFGPDASGPPGPDPSSGTGAGDADVQDAGRVADALTEPLTGEAGAFFPPTMRGRGFLCEVDGQTLERGELVEVDDCVVCQCSTWGFRCRRRPSCQRDVCVFVDGTTVPSGSSAIVEKCFDCRCEGGTPSCARRTGDGCPLDGCYTPPGLLTFGTELAIGKRQFVSECHECTCDANAGLLCKDRCHPECVCFHTEEGVDMCPKLCGKGGCLPMPEAGLFVPDQERVPAGTCATLLCDYGELLRDESRCP